MAGIVANARPIAVFGATAARSRSAAHRPLPQSYSVHLGYQHTIWLTRNAKILSQMNHLNQIGVIGILGRGNPG
jgi:hypothetical protein